MRRMPEVAIPKVSIVVPSYNKPEYLVECLQSIQAQTFEDWECIVVSDGSPRVDEIRAAVEGMRDPRFRLVEHTENRGAAAARNTGIREAKAEHVIFVDEDDRLREDCLTVLLGELIARRAEVVCPQGRFFGGADRRRFCKVPSVGEILVGQPLLPAGALIQREVFRKVGEYDENEIIRGREDHEWWIRVVSAGVQIAVLDEELYYIRRASTEEEFLDSLDFSACRYDHRIYRYITMKHSSIYSQHKGACKTVIRKALLREAERFDWEGRSLQALVRRWRAALVSGMAKDFRAAMKASLVLMFGRRVTEVILERLRMVLRPQESGVRAAE